MTKQRKPARFIGVETYVDPLGRFTVRFPVDWHRRQLEHYADSVAWSPEEDEFPKTWFGLYAQKLEHHAEAEDIELLSEAINEGLAQLQQCQILSEANDNYNDMLKFERIYTYEEDGVVRKRRAWYMYIAEWQLVIMWQGETIEDYEHWLSMGNYSFATFNVAPELWFATDRAVQQQIAQKTPRGRIRAATKPEEPTE